MPLHLLGKKSWNVYNADNVARVQRDEAAARAREEAEEQRMQEVDAERRLAILRGEVPPPLEDVAPADAHPSPSREDRRAAREGTVRKRKRAGEDDTDFEMRVAREQADAGERISRELAVVTTKPGPTTTSLVDSAGHISLFGEAQELAARRTEKNEEAEKEKAKKNRELADQYQMRFANAAGKNGLGLTDGGPWYVAADGDASAALVPSKDVWGNDDPRRKVREAARLDTSDPLAMMKRGAAKVREIGKERKRDAEEREKELETLRKAERRRQKKRRRHDGSGRGETKDRERTSSRARHADVERHDRSDHRRYDEDRSARDKERHRDEDRHRHRSRRPDHDATDRHSRHHRRDDRR
ncbi:hypothetical protein B0T25DRAFT_556754 [Lasiosphaeria hispida]|uniref:CBF1-interacting co-repressor CIR N-terminal domain-containing protein n=1 Tax=Lasiosphaeria hispida TaxID=260671 RepID=A0AAJ0H9S5_9PEZI|nr:hypothetical protein B0T25DRAFT_556754 [Lasiosphaeria hispida]